MLALPVLALFFSKLAFSAALDPPQQVHLAFAGRSANKDSNGFAVSWQTAKATASSVVYYGTSPSALDSFAEGTQHSYYASYDHHVILENLQPKTTYFYRCGDETAGLSEVFSFTTAPDVLDVEFPINIAIFGDLGWWYSEDTRALLEKWGNEGKYDWLWHLGDVGYADDDFLHQPLKDGYEDAWNRYMNSVQSFTSKYAYMVLPGNHEAECHSPACQVSREKLQAFGNFSAYNHRFRMPSKESGGNSNMWYSFNYGPIHFVNIDTETNFEGAPEDHYTWFGGNGEFWGDQIAWLEEDLKQANEERDIRPWIFVAGHRPVYSLHDAEDDGTPALFAKSLQDAVEPLFNKYKVDVYWCGHVHGYERQWPVYDTVNVEVGSDYTDPKYTVYIVHGAAGNDEQHESYRRVPEAKWNVLWDNKHYGVGLLTVESRNVLSWQFVDSKTEKVLDSVTIKKTKV